jgi:putative MFS transporter
MAILEGFWPIGFVCSGLLALAILPHYGWRGVFMAEAIPAVFVLVVRRFVPESPRWLEDRGEHARADATMTRIEASVRRAFGRELPPPSMGRATSTAERRMSFLELWAPRYARRTMMLWVLWFFALLGFYGLTTWLGALLQQGGFAVTKSVNYTILISLAGFPGFFTAAYLIEAWGRKATLIAMLSGSAAMAYLYGTSSTQTTLIVFGLLMQFCLFGMWSALYAYTPELYPSRARATGAGCASAVGRVGSLIGPYAVGVILPAIGQGGVFSLGAGAFVVAALAVVVLGEETRGRALEEIAA